MMKLIPRGHIIKCPYCGIGLYRVGRDVSLDDSPLVSLKDGVFVAIYPQPLISLTHSSKIQECYSCSGDFPFLDLIREEFIGGSKYDIKK